VGTFLLIPPQKWTEETLTAHLRHLEACIPPASANLYLSVDEVQSIDPKIWKRHLYHYLRWALLGGQRGPGIAETLEILGRETCVERIRDADLKAREVENFRAKPVLQAEGFRGTVEGRRRIGKSWTAHSLR